MKRSTVILWDSHRRWSEEEIPVLEAETLLPRLSSSIEKKSARRFNHFYRRYARSFYRFCIKELLPRAIADHRAALRENRPLPLTRAVLRSTVTCEKNGLVSLFTDLTVTAPGRRFHARTSDTWDLDTGCPIPLCQCFPSGAYAKKDLLRLMRQSAAQRKKDGEPFREDYRRALRRFFSSRRFYLTDEGVVLYYQRGSLAPPQQGVVSFLLPLDEGGPLPPA